MFSHDSRYGNSGDEVKAQASAMTDSNERLTQEPPRPCSLFRNLNDGCLRFDNLEATGET
jgi:hypothetical protein